MTPTPFPLCWPPATPRTIAVLRLSPSRFARKAIAATFDELRREAFRLADSGGRVVISSDVIRKADGRPYADACEPDDPGVAVHLVRNDRAYALATDTYNRVWANMHALAITIHAIRAIERHGSTGLFEQALGGFAALPPALELAAPWWAVLGFDRPVPLAEARARAKAIHVEQHPDRAADEADRARRTEIVTSASVALRLATEAAERGEVAA